MVASVIAKPFGIFAYGVDKTTQVEDKVTTFAKKSFSSIKNIKFESLNDVPSKIFKFVKENKFHLALATLSLAITAVVFVNISATAALLFLGAVSFVKIYAYTRSYVKSYDYQFRKLAKDYICCLEELCKNHKNGKQLSNDLVTGQLKSKLYNLQEKLIDFVYQNAENYDQFISWKTYLNNLNPNLRLFSASFPKFATWKKYNDNAFKNGGNIAIATYTRALFNHIKTDDKTNFETQLKDFVKKLDPKSPTLKKDILEKAKTIDSFATDSTKRDIALRIFKAMTSPPRETQTPSSTTQSTLSDKALNAASHPLKFVKSFFSTTPE